MMTHAVDPHNKKVEPVLEQLVEEICQLGCDAVNDVITQIGQGQVPELAVLLSAQQLKQLQAELEEIMAALKH